MEDDLSLYFSEVMADARQPAEARRLATRLHQGWSMGVIPAHSDVQRLRKLTQNIETCIRLTPDGSCPWLRKNARQEGLRTPGPGEKAFCHRRASGTLAASFSGCAGFRKGAPE